MYLAESRLKPQYACPKAIPTPNNNTINTALNLQYKDSFLHDVLPNAHLHNPIVGINHSLQT